MTMARYSRSHLTNDALLRSFDSHLAQNRSSTADLLADLAEIDERKLFLPAGYPSLYAYCLGEKRMSEDTASRWIHAARAARSFPAIFYAVADARLHLTAVGLLLPASALAETHAQSWRRRLTSPSRPPGDWWSAD